LEGCGVCLEKRDFGVTGDFTIFAMNSARFKTGVDPGDSAKLAFEEISDDCDAGGTSTDDHGGAFAGGHFEERNVDVEVECVEMENRMIESVPKGWGNKLGESKRRGGGRKREKDWKRNRFIRGYL